MDRSWYDRLRRSCSSWAKLTQVIPTSWSLQPAAFALCFFCSIAFAVYPLPTPPMPGTSGECNLMSHWQPSGRQWCHRGLDTNLWCCHTSQWVTCHSHQYNAWRRKKSCQRRKQSSESKFMWSVEGVCQCCCSPLGVFSQVLKPLCVSVVMRMEVFLITCVLPSKESQNQMWYSENYIDYYDCRARYRFFNLYRFHNLCVTWM